MPLRVADLVLPDSATGVDRQLLATLAADPRTGTALGLRDGVLAIDELTVLNDTDGLLTAALLRAHDGPVRARCDSRAATDRLADLFAAELASGRLHLATGPDPQPLTELLPVRPVPDGDDGAAALVVTPLPKSLRELDEIAQAAAGYGAALLGTGPVKHLSRSMNEALARHYQQVHATLARHKARSLVAAVPVAPAVPDAAASPNLVSVAGHRVALCSVGGVFHGDQPDHGSTLLLAALAERGPRTVRRVHDLGSGNGLCSAWLVQQFPAAEVRASDDSADAVAATRATLAATAAAVRAELPTVLVTWQDALAEEETASCDLVVLNPPFHQGAAVDPSLARRLFAAAARVLRRGGELWVVHNSHLRYRVDLERAVGPVTEIDRDRRFTVLRAIRD